MQNLDGKIAFVTGASRGIGKAIALKLADEGVNVCITARSSERLEEVVKECEVKGVKALAIAVDASNLDKMRSAVDQCVEELGGLHILVNNAGMAGYSHQEFSKWEQTIQLNLISPMAIAQHAIQYLEKNNSSAVIQISSIAGKKPLARAAPYSASKHGVNGYMETLFEEVRDKNIKVCTICPGFVDTDMVTPLKKDTSKMIQAIDIAETVIFVAKFPSRACPTEITILPQCSTV